MRNIAIIGSTGSIGTQTLDIVREHDDLSVCAMAAGTNIKLFEKQVREFSPAIACLWDEAKARELAGNLKDTNVRVVSGMDGLLEVAAYMRSDLLVTAVVGMIGIRPTIEAIRAGKDIALANKETLVCAGHIIMPMAKQFGVRILPVDSEHSAIFQCLHGERSNPISRLLITASGGPFRGKDRDYLTYVTVEDALKHPNWSMGAKITIDSATMVNKGLEVIEARWLFDVPPGQIDVVVQPQSIIHSMVEFEDGSVKAQLGTPDMHLPIQYALYYPKHLPLPGERLDFKKLKSIEIDEVDRDTFRGLDFAYLSLAMGGTMPTVFNAANEKAVALFLEKDIKFLQIYDIIEACMKRHKVVSNPTVKDILAAEADVYAFIDSMSWR